MVSRVSKLADNNLQANDVADKNKARLRFHGLYY